MEKKPYTLFADAIGSALSDCRCPNCSKIALLFEEAVLAIGKVSDNLTEEDVARLDELVGSEGHDPSRAAFHSLCFTLFALVAAGVASKLISTTDVGGIFTLAAARGESYHEDLEQETKH